MKILINQLNKNFGKKRVFCSYSQEFGPTGVVGLTGKNGSGKTTLLKILCGILTPDAGSVYYNDQNIQKNKNKIMEEVGALFDGTRHLYWRLTAQQNFLYFGGLKGCYGNATKSYGNSLFSFFEIEEYSDVRVEALSLGAKRKVSLCCALANNPSVLFLDEPTNGLDENSKELLSCFLESFSLNGKLAIVASHDKNWLKRTCNRIIKLDNSI
jgi:ABC-2 type transport system ATP-binding protein